MSRFTLLSLGLFCLVTVQAAFAHDTWVETNSNLVRTGNAVYVDLKLGNHGNEHRDFKQASKIDLDSCSLDVVDPQGNRYDLIPQLHDTGYAPNEGYWTGKFVAMKPGLYSVEHKLDKIVNHGRPVRSIKSGKTFFVASPTLDEVNPDNPGFDRVAGHPLELVPVANPVTPMGPGKPLKIKVLFKDKPLTETRVSFIPAGVTLSEGFDQEYERTTDSEGIASFTPRTGNSYLVVVHHRSPEEKGTEYEETIYSATLTVLVPEVCPCCGQ
ncbi:MAG: DUF4198 domain-containing protein [Planctomycetaceae bacterium]|nr:DUF4198 domain-containing protein [Planctomycetaceae bacterium]